MTTQRLPIWDCIVYGFKAMYKYPWEIFKLMIVWAATGVAFLASLLLIVTFTDLEHLIDLDEKFSSVAGGFSTQEGEALLAFVPIVIIFACIAIILYAGSLRYMYDLHTTGTARLRTVATFGWRLALPFFGLLLLLIPVGLIICLLPYALFMAASFPVLALRALVVGIVVLCYGWTRAWYASWIMVDQGVGPIVSIKRSITLTQGHVFEIFLLWVLLVLMGYLLRWLIMLNPLITGCIAVPIDVLIQLRSYSWLKERVGVGVV